MTELEAMAKAISSALSDFDWSHLNDYARSNYANAARAALMAIRAPSDGMVEAGLRQRDECTDGGTASAACVVEHVWPIMIDQILNASP